MNIKVEKVNQVSKLFEVIDSCTMNVELIDFLREDAQYQAEQGT